MEIKHLQFLVQLDLSNLNKLGIMFFFFSIQLKICESNVGWIIVDPCVGQ